MLIKEIIQSIRNINEYLNGYSPNELYVCLNYMTDGYCEKVTYLDQTIWDSNSDEREFNEEKNEYEPMEQFLRKKVKIINNNIWDLRI